MTEKTSKELYDEEDSAFEVSADFFFLGFFVLLGLVLIALFSWFKLGL